MLALAAVSPVGIVAASMGEVDASAFVTSVRSLAHLVGITASLMLVYYAYRARTKFSGGVFGESASFVMVGGSVFTVAFVVMELGHGFGLDLLSFVPGMQMKMAVNMVLFTATVFAFGWAFYLTANVLEGR